MAHADWPADDDLIVDIDGFDGDGFRPATVPPRLPPAVDHGRANRDHVAVEPSDEDWALPTGMSAPADADNAFADSLAAHLLRLADAPGEFDFFHAVRLLECANPDRPRVGHSTLPADDYVRFSQEATLAFTPASIASFKQSDHGPSRMTLNFMGMLGVNGPLPLFLTDYVRRRRGRGDRAMARFLDIFNHRMASLFYRAWAMHQRSVGYDRPGQDRFATYVGSLFGIGMPSFRGRDELPDVAKLGFSGLLACQARNADGLTAILEGYFGVPTAIEQFVGQWIDVPQENHTRLGVSRATGVIGDGVLLGSRVWDCQQKFRIRMGPMDFETYRRLLPDGASLKRLEAWVRNYIGEELAWDLQLVLKADEVPQVRLGMVGQLGWSSWALSGPAGDNRDDLTLDVLAN